MREQAYMTRREMVGFGQSRRAAALRRKTKGLGSISQIVILVMITLGFGLIYVAEGTRATGYDYKISQVEAEIQEMTAKKEDLAVERARLTSMATAKNSAVAKAMETATVTGYVQN